LKPGIHIAESRLTGFHTQHTGQNRAIYLSTNAANEQVTYLFVGCNQHIAGGSSHYPNQGIWLDPRSNRSHVRIERANSHNHVFG